jgi:hypothetical protein
MSLSQIDIEKAEATSKKYIKNPIDTSKLNISKLESITLLELSKETKLNSDLDIKENAKDVDIVIDLTEIAKRKRNKKKKNKKNIKIEEKWISKKVKKINKLKLYQGSMNVEKEELELNKGNSIIINGKKIMKKK